MSEKEVALIVGGGPGISASCARLFAQQGMRVAVAARDTEKPVLRALAQDHGVTLIACDASEPASVRSLFDEVARRLGPPRLVVHNIDGRPREVFRKSITEVDAQAVLATLKNSTFSAFLVGQQAAKAMLELEGRDGHKGTGAARRLACAPTRRPDRRRQHGTSRPHRRRLPSSAPPAQVHLGVRSGAASVDGNLVRRAIT